MSNLSELKEIARIVVKGGLLGRLTEDQALTLCLIGEELGLSPMQSLRSLHLINGKPILSADLMVALVRRSPECEQWRLVESSDKLATYTTKRRGDAECTTLSYTIEQARTAQIAGKGTWGAHPAAMLRARCASALVRVVYPDLMLGVYEEDEGREMAARALPPVYAPAPRDLPQGEVLPALPAPEVVTDDPGPGPLSEEEFGRLRRRVLKQPTRADLDEVTLEIKALKDAGRLDLRDCEILAGDVRAARAAFKQVETETSPPHEVAAPVVDPAPAPKIAPAKLARAVVPGSWPAWAEVVAKSAIRACEGDPGAAEVVAGIVAEFDRALTVGDSRTAYERLIAAHPQGYHHAITTLAHLRESEVAPKSDKKEEGTPPF